MLIRELRPDDRAEIAEALEACGAFSAEEVRVALDIFDDGTYPHFGAEIAGRVEGYVCVDKTPLTQSTWHIYWLCVHPQSQGRGVGRALETFAANHVRDAGGRRVVVETSGRPDYERARMFYSHAGYYTAGRIADYYKPGDDCVFLVKVLT